MSRRKIYMAVTPDKYELPLFVGTSEEVAAWAHISLSNLQSLVSRTRQGDHYGRRTGRKFVAVEDD